MATNLCFVAHAPERHAHELPPECARDRPTQRRLAYARWADEAENRSLHVPHQRQHPDVVEDAVLHFLETIMILVEHPPSVCDVEDVVAALGPRQAENPIDVVTRDGRLRR